MKKEKVVFITGATGFVGSYVTRELLTRGYEVIALVRGENAEYRLSRILSQVYGNPGEYDELKRKLQVIRGDIVNDNLGISPQDSDDLRQRRCRVIHCAASVSFNETERSRIEEQNIVGTKNTLKFMRMLDLRELHYISTAYVAGKRTGIIYEEDLDKGQGFHNVYEESKFKAETLVREYSANQGIRVAVYRPSIIVGSSITGRTSNYSGFYSYIRSLCILIRMMKTGKQGSRHMPLRVPGSASRTLNMLPVDYAADVIARIFDSESSLNKTYHIVNPDPPTFAHAQEAVSDYLGLSGVRIVDPSEFQINVANKWEKIFLGAIKSITPYLQEGGPVFSDINTRELLEGTGIKCPEVSKEFIFKLISHCLDTNWGKNAECVTVS